MLGSHFVCLWMETPSHMHLFSRIWPIFDSNIYLWDFQWWCTDNRLKWLPIIVSCQRIVMELPLPHWKVIAKGCGLCKVKLWNYVHLSANVTAWLQRKYACKAFFSIWEFFFSDLVSVRDAKALRLALMSNIELKWVRNWADNNNFFDLAKVSCYLTDHLHWVWRFNRRYSGAWTKDSFGKNRKFLGLQLCHFCGYWWISYGLYFSSNGCSPCASM